MSKCIFFFILLMSSSQVLANTLFRILPYTLRHTNQHLLLNFELTQDKNLIIEDDGGVIPAQLFRKNQHYQFELKIAECGVTKNLIIKDALNSSILFSRKLPSFECAPSPIQSEYTFGFISDTQRFLKRHELVANVIAHHHSLTPLQFLIHGGDVVENGAKESEWLEYFQGGHAYLTDIPQIAVIGNHDYKKSKLPELPKFFQKFMRWQGSPVDGNLLYELPGLQLIIFNSNTAEFSRQEEKRMWAWLEEKMQQAQQKNIPIIVTTHFPIYSTIGERFIRPSIIKLRRHLAPLAEKYGVKLILSGHAHMYERSFKDGVNYLVAGPAGGRRNTLPKFKNKYRQIVDREALTFTKIKYSNRSLKIETFNEENVLIDQLFLNL